jgi:hypothetical protein
MNTAEDELRQALMILVTNTFEHLDEQIQAVDIVMERIAAHDKQLYADLLVRQRGYLDDNHTTKNPAIAVPSKIIEEKMNALGIEEEIV